MMIPSSITRLVEAISNTIAAVKFAPLRNNERASATDAYEQLDEAAPRPVVISSVFGESSGISRRISPLETTACTNPESANPRISAHNTSQVIPNANETACHNSCGMFAASNDWQRNSYREGRCRGSVDAVGGRVKGILGAEEHDPSPHRESTLAWASVRDCP